MADYDATEFVDSDFQAHKAPFSASPGMSGPRAPTREEVDSRVAEAQQKLAELKRAQEQLERNAPPSRKPAGDRSISRRPGRNDPNLTRGLGLLEEAEFAARHDADQMAKAMIDLRDALTKVQSINEETWTKDSFPLELTRGLTAIENAQMGWNAARLKFPVLAGAKKTSTTETPSEALPGSVLGTRNFGELCKLGLAMTWPLALVAVLALATFAIILLRR